jgi:DNA helicase HerA-like ATPase
VTGELESDRLAAGLAEYRDVRDQLEALIQPLATSLDGRSFSYQAPVALTLQAGGYVVLEGEGRTALGQVLELELTLFEGSELAGTLGDDGTGYRTHVRVRAATGHGTILDRAAVPMPTASIRPARADEVGALLTVDDPPRAMLSVGEAMFAPGVPVALDAGGFDRHTFLCGQSGSGKTYALGVVLEQLLLETDLRILVLDPNSDFVRMRDLRAAADPGAGARWADLADGIVIRRASGDSDDRSRLHLRVADLGPAAQAALLQLDPVADREEYDAFLTVLESGPYNDSVAALWSDPGAAATPELRRLGLRIRNLGLDRWDLWSRGQDESVLDQLDRTDWRCMVVDLGSLGSPEERSLMAEALLGRLWQRRSQRQPLLIVIDEAHNVCPQHPADALTAQATEHAVRIAAEGRKFGLYLLTSTQRPQKVHENIVSQCDNLLLMRMNSAADIAQLAEVFSYVPQGLITRSMVLRQGESLAAGKIMPHPIFLRFGARVAEEGGADVPATWARPREAG